jgi:hypothetical protein
MMGDAMSTDGWVPDPSGRHAYRYVREGQWTDSVSDGGDVATDPLQPPVGAAHQGRPKRGVRWIVLALVGGLVLAGLASAVLFGIGMSIKDLDTYEADLTTGSGDFPGQSSDAQVTEYTAEGFRMASIAPDQTLFSAVRATGVHSVLSVTVEVENVAASPGSAIGPVCWGDAEDPTGLQDLSGFQLGLAPDGSVVLSALVLGERRVLDTGVSDPFGPGTTATLTLVCGTFGGQATASGYVGGARAVFAQVGEPDEEYTYTGFLAQAPEPSEWLVTSFERRGPDDLPPGWDES